MKRLLRTEGFFISCCVCKKIKVADGTFIDINSEEIDKTDIKEFSIEMEKRGKISHTYCPPCYAKVKSEIDLIHKG